MIPIPTITYAQKTTRRVRLLSHRLRYQFFDMDPAEPLEEVWLVLVEGGGILPYVVRQS